MQLKSGIYKITCLHSNSFYIGSAKNIKHRWNVHLSDLRKNKHHNIIIQRKYNKYGIENFKFDILANCPPEYLVKLEQWFIDNLKPELNIYLTAFSPIGYKHSEETKNKISNIKVGVKKPVGFGEKLSLLFKGRTVSNITKLKLKNAYAKRSIKGNPTILDEEKVKEIKLLLLDGRSLSYISKIYNISSPMVSRIKNNHAWKHVKID